MLIQILLAIFAGTFFGVFTGLIPGIHVNLIGVFLISLSSTLLFNINPLYLVIFIVAIAITHIFIDFIPSIFLGCPDTDTELSVLPGHELLKKGEGYEAIMLTAYGSLAAVFLIIGHFRIWRLKFPGIKRTAFALAYGIIWKFNAINEYKKQTANSRTKN